VLITLCRKSMIGGGYLQIDACRVGTSGGTRRDGLATKPNSLGWENMRGHKVALLDAGRWPSNLILESVALIPADQYRTFLSIPCLTNSTMHPS